MRFGLRNNNTITTNTAPSRCPQAEADWPLVSCKTRASNKCRTDARIWASESLKHWGLDGSQRRERTATIITRLAQQGANGLRIVWLMASVISEVQIESVFWLCSHWWGELTVLSRISLCFGLFWYTLLVKDKRHEELCIWPSLKKLWKIFFLIQGSKPVTVAPNLLEESLLFFSV